MCLRTYLEKRLIQNEGNYALSFFDTGGEFLRKILFVCTIITFLLLVACSQEENSNSSGIIFDSEGGQWKATILNNEIKRDGKRYFRIIYQYKGDLMK
jgi:hypothetical protein